MGSELDFISGIVIGFFGGFSICCLLSVRLAGILQQCAYHGGSFLKWYFSKGNIQRKRISLFFLAQLLLTALFAVCFSFLPYVYANFIGLVPCLGLLVLYLFSEKKYALKVPMNKTARLMRLLIMNALICFGISVGAGIGFAALSLKSAQKWFFYFRFVPLSLLPLFLPILLTVANLLMKFYEVPHNGRFIRRAEKVLRESGCKKVGITGSFGKTSVKRFAEQMLSEKYTVVATPSSFNTPMGIARTVLERGLDCDIFLAEMGARHTGDIQELCDLVQPEIGVITGVCPQHIETFGSLENIKREKGVLAERVDTVVLGSTVNEFSAKNALREGKDFSMCDLVSTANGFSFRWKIKDQEVWIKTRLLGKSAAEDVSVAAALCFALGMTPAEIALAAGSLEPVPHRLEKLEANGLIILDDSYNSNIEGAKNAIETLRLFPGKKVVVTPGLVELGKLEESMNEALGSRLCGLDVILVGETLVLSVQRGYLAAGGDEKRIRIVPTLQKAQEILASELKDGDCVLFLNDLPDIYR